MVALEVLLIVIFDCNLACFYAPAICNGGGGGHIASPLSVRLYFCTSLLPFVLYVRKMVSGRYLFEYIGVLDSYFIHRYIIIKYRSSSITDKIHRLLSELWPLKSKWKMVLGDIFWIQQCVWFIFHTQVYNLKIQVKFNYR